MQTTIEPKAVLYQKTNLRSNPIYSCFNILVDLLHYIKNVA